MDDSLQRELRFNGRFWNRPNYQKAAWCGGIAERAFAAEEIKGKDIVGGSSLAGWLHWKLPRC
jgi:hypothetical protein